MKTLVATLLATVVATFSLEACLLAQQISPNLPAGTPSPLIVHEWGTFTTLAGSDGVLLPGLYREEAPLPYFVHYSPGFSYGGYIHKGLYLECSDVTLKMETPVIYFYSDAARSVSVRVDWPGGTISQWYPERSDGEAPSSNIGYLDFSTPHNGWIEWNVNLQPKLNPDSAGLYKPSQTNIWTAPRATDANIIRDSAGATGNPDEVEKYLFYRGVGNANFMDGATGGHYILQTAFHNDTLVITNQTEYGIGYALVFERAVNPQNELDSMNTIWWSGAIKPSAEVRCRRPVGEESGSWDQALTDLRDNLVTAGLYEKEADAMVQTWKQSYFGTMGLRVFWIVPRISTDQSLPLKVSPQPDDIQRVLIARSEVLTPEFEKQLLQTGVSNYYGDRYYLAYQARYTALMTAGVTASPRTTAALSVYPNPSNGTFTFTSSEQIAKQITILNLLGQPVAQLSTGDLKGSTHSFTWDAHGMPAGMYTCVVHRNGSVEQVPIMLVR